MMIRGKFLSTRQRADLEDVLRHQREEHGVARRANAILLLDDGESCQTIAKFLYLDDDTIRTWHKQYMSGGFDGLFTFDWRGGTSRMSAAEEADLCAHFSRTMPRNTHEVRDYIRRIHGYDFSRSGAIKLMHRLGFVYRRPALLPAEADEDKQRDFIERYEALQRHLPDDEVIYFVDAVHPEHQSRPAHGWIRKGEKVALKRNSGRKRVNLHGAVNLENFHCPVVEADRINADSTIALFEKLEAENAEKSCIHVILDNARYHHARAVKDWMRRTKSRINLVFLPAYAPHLNAIERLWGVMHKYVTHNRFYSTYRQFAEAILAFFSRTVPKEWPEFRDTVTDNFRIISFQNFRVLE